MTPVDIAEKWYASSLNARSDVTSSLTSPLTAVSILAGGTALLMANYEPSSHAVSNIITALFYISSSGTLLAVAYSLLNIINILFDDELYHLTPSVEQRNALEDFYHITSKKRQDNLMLSLDGKLTQAYLAFAEDNDARNKKVKSRRKRALYGIIVSITAFLLSVVSFGVSSLMG